MDPVLSRRVGDRTLVVYPAERSTLAMGRPRRGGSDTVYDVVVAWNRRTVDGVRCSRATLATSCTYTAAERTLAGATPRLLTGLRYR